MAISFTAGQDRLDPGRHVATATEIKTALVDAFSTAVTRGPLYDQWRVLNQAIEKILPIEEQWVNGSFVTTKLNPGDIDLVTHFDGARLAALDAGDRMLLKGLVAGHQSRDLHLCDSFVIAIYPNGHPWRSRYEALSAYFDGLFGKDRTGNAKGYVEVDLHG